MTRFLFKCPNKMLLLWVCFSEMFFLQELLLFLNFYMVIQP